MRMIQRRGFLFGSAAAAAGALAMKSALAETVTLPAANAAAPASDANYWAVVQDLYEVDR